MSWRRASAAQIGLNEDSAEALGALLLALGAVATGEMLSPWELATRYGRAGLCVRPSLTGPGAALFFRFDEPHRTEGHLFPPANSFSGKWNRSYETSDPEEILRLAALDLKGLL